ncbi:MAG: ECF transporter S component [Clostridia bacterium]|nr:ECF transporter S component [Clostridia bacterium]
MKNKQRNRYSVLYLTQLALLVAVECVMKMIGLGSVPVGPLYMSFLTVPIAIGAIVMGPMASMILGGVFGFVSFMDAIKGASIMTSNLLAVSPVHTFALCFVMRVLMGLCVGGVYGLMTKISKKRMLNCFVTSLSAPLLNTLLFMGYIVLAFYQTEYIQGMAAANGAANPMMFVAALVGVQGVVEAVVCSVVGTAVAGGLLKAFGRPTR